MKIKSFRFDDNKENWHLKETFFDDFNLLVGISGVGKTKILQALNLVCDVATDNNYRLDGIDWKISFIHLGQEYEWELKSALMDEDVLQESKSSEILSL
jgi:energy-coupling factor transporter ATP-binding protein EcfA2